MDPALLRLATLHPAARAMPSNRTHLPQQPQRGIAARCRDTSHLRNFSTPLLQPFNASEQWHEVWTKHNVTSIAQASARCPHKEATIRDEEERRQFSCADYAAHSKGWQSIRLLIGIATGPQNQKRRDTIRQTWMRWPSVGRSDCDPASRRSDPVRHRSAGAHRDRDDLLHPQDELTTVLQRMTEDSHREIPTT